MKENCQTYLTAKATPVEAPPSTPLGEADSVKPVKPTPGPLIMPSSQPTPGAIVPTAASIKRIRAQSLLDVLSHANIRCVNVCSSNGV